MLNTLTPGEAAGWRRHFHRYPPDGAERMLSLLFSLQCAEPKPPDWRIRPWAYTADEVEALEAERAEVQEAEAEASGQRALAKILA